MFDTSASPEAIGREVIAYLEYCDTHADTLSRGQEIKESFLTQMVARAERNEREAEQAARDAIAEQNCPLNGCRKTHHSDSRVARQHAAMAEAAHR